MTGTELKNSILQYAIQGKLVPQNPAEEPASALLERIRAQKQELVKQKKLRPSKTETLICRTATGNYTEQNLFTGETTDITDQIPFPIPPSWQWARLGDISIYIQRGKSPKYSPIKKYPVVAQKCNQWSGFSIEKAQFIDPESLSKYSEDRFLQDEDLMWNSTGLGTLGRMAVYYSRLNPYELAVADSHVTVIRIIRDLAIPKFFYFYFASPIVQAEIEDKAGGSTNQKELSTRTISNYLIPVPPREEQERIVAKLDELLPLVERYSVAQTELDKLNASIKEELRKSILQEAIRGELVEQREGEEPASVLLERIRTQKQELVKQKKLRPSKTETLICRTATGNYTEKNLFTGKTTDITDQIPFPIPPSWQWCRGKDIFRPMASTKPMGETFMYVDIDAIDNKKQSIRTVKNIKTTEAPSRASRYTQKGDILFSMVRPYLRNIARVTRDNCIASTGFYICSPTELVLSDYCYYLMISPYVVNGLNQFMKGDNSPSINKGDIENWLFPVPPREEQERIVAKVDELFSALDAIRNNLQP